MTTTTGMITEFHFDTDTLGRIAVTAREVEQAVRDARGLLLRLEEFRAAVRIIEEREHFAEADEEQRREDRDDPPPF